jgi:hypothetical protein
MHEFSGLFRQFSWHLQLVNPKFLVHNDYTIKPNSYFNVKLFNQGVYFVFLFSFLQQETSLYYFDAIVQYWELKTKEDFVLSITQSLQSSQHANYNCERSNLYSLGEIYLHNVIIDRHSTSCIYFRAFKNREYCPYFQNSSGWLAVVKTPLVSGTLSPGTTNKASPWLWTTKTGTKVSPSRVSQQVVWRWLLRLDRGKTRHAMLLMFTLYAK